ncbi:MAG: hypothetical protein J0H98_09500 [Solirubrobacterales bacterium]|nr:hypothetical protein [Solirubrobacterales bacterium]
MDEATTASRERIQDAQKVIRAALDPSDHRAIDGASRIQDISLKKTYARTILWILGAQLVVANSVFIAYAWVGVGWHVPPGIMATWMSTTLVEVLGIVAIVTRYLFPNGGGSLLTVATVPEPPIE